MWAFSRKAELAALFHAAQLAFALDLALALRAAPGLKVALTLKDRGGGGSDPRGARGALAGFALPETYLPLIDVTKETAVEVGSPSVWKLEVRAVGVENHSPPQTQGRGCLLRRQ